MANRTFGWVLLLLAGVVWAGICYVFSLPGVVAMLGGIVIGAVVMALALNYLYPDAGP